MGTTRIKVIDLSSDEKEIKTSRKRAEKLAGVSKLKKTAKADKKPVTESTETQHSVPSDTTSQPSVITKPVEESLTTTNQPEDLASSVVSRKQSRHHKGKKYQTAKKLVQDKVYTTKDAIALLPKTSITSFDPSVEIHLNVIDKNLKGSVNFPHQVEGKKKETKYLIFNDQPSEALATSKALATEVAKEGKRIVWGDEKTITDIEQGKLKPKKDFDIVIASPKFMPLLAKVAKILGPAHLMPNPKNGTVTEDIKKVLEGQSEGTYKFKTDPNSPVVHAKIGKLSQGDDKLSENLKTLIFAIGTSKIKKAVITSTMGPAIKLDLASFG